MHNMTYKKYIKIKFWEGREIEIAVQGGKEQCRISECERKACLCLFKWVIAQQIARVLLGW